MTDENEICPSGEAIPSPVEGDVSPISFPAETTEELSSKDAAIGETDLIGDPLLSEETSAPPESEKEIPSSDAQDGEPTEASDENDDLPKEAPEDAPVSLPVPVEETVKKGGEKKPRNIDSRFDLAELFIFSLVAVLLLSAFVFRHTIVDGGSMENTLHDGESLIISDLFYTPKTGDIIVCEDYHTPFRKPLIKRVIATGGQTVMILPTGVYVDGFLLEEEYVHTEPGYRYTPVPEFTVPDGMIYVMGDHRDNSTDSRAFGCVSEESVLGRVLLRYYPFSRFGTVD